MATESPLIHDGSQTTAAVDLSAKQFFAVQISAARAVNLETTGGKVIYGILQNKPKAGAAADVGIIGVTKAIAGAAVTTGGWPLMTDTTGKLIAQTGTNHTVAYAIEAASGTSTIFTVVLAGIGGSTVS